VASRIRLACTAAALIPLAVLAAACSSSPSSTTKPAATTPAAPKTGSITESGSSLLFPLFGDWTPGYTAAHPGIKLSTASTSSGVGITDAATGLVDVGASDAYLSSADTSQYPTLLNIPLAVAAVMVNYNVTGVTNLKLNGTVLAQIYTGKITTWNNSAIAALNPGVTLPSEPIVTLHRGDSSGSTFLFTSYLDAQDPSVWPATNVGTTITWPSVPGALAETGSGGMVTGCGSTKGCIAYIGVSYLAKITAAGLGEAELANAGGQYALPTSAAISAALSSFPTVPSSGTQALINTKATAGYPIINYEYAVINKTQSSATQAALLQNFLTWLVTTGNTSKYLSQVGFQPLPAKTLAVSKSLISSITG
jgi:phosphate transport system substrate-binding protein